MAVSYTHLDVYKRQLFDIAGIEEIVAPGEVDRFYINFCDPWPKAKHAKRRLTYHTFLDRYARLLKEGGEVHFKTDNEGLFMFSLEAVSYTHLAYPMMGVIAIFVIICAIIAFPEDEKYNRI